MKIDSRLKKKELTLDQSLEAVEKSIEKYDHMVKNDLWNEPTARKVIEQRLNQLSFVKSDLLKKKYGEQKRIPGYKSDVPMNTGELMKLIG